MIGVTVRFASFKGAHENVWHVLVGGWICSLSRIHAMKKTVFFFFVS
jgi:hypothetical protein